MSDVPGSANLSLVRLAAWLQDKPSFGDVRHVTEKDRVMVGDIRVALQGALSLWALTETLHTTVGATDQERTLSAILMDALGDRELLQALDRVGGMLRREQLDDGPMWKYDHKVQAVEPQEDADLRNVLASVRRQADNRVVLQEVAEAECFT